jgi:hypothetical protein
LLDQYQPLPATFRHNTDFGFAVVAEAVCSCAENNKWKDEDNEVEETCFSGKNNTILLLGQRIRGAVVLSKINETSTTDYK